MIKITELNKYFNKKKSNEIHVINNTSLELPSSGLVSFLGHSGSGKTTLLNVIGGLDKATGTIAYDSFEMKKYNMHKMDVYRSKHIGYVFQNYNLILEETVYDNLKVALEIIGVTNLEEIDKRIEYTLKAVGMYKYRKKKAFALSGGQQQRVSIARALLKNCKIIIADEPTGNLDKNNTIEVMNILKKISKDALVLLVTHDQNLARFYSDYVFELKDGSIIHKEEIAATSHLEMDRDNVIYLQDMKQEASTTPVGKMTIYTEEESIPFDLDFIIKNGTIYLKSNQPIKLISNTNLKVVDGHYEPQSKPLVEDFNYDTSWYRDLKENKHILKRFLSSLKSGFLRFINVKKRVKFLYFSLVFLGFICAIAVIGLINSTTVDISGYHYNENYSTYVSYDYMNGSPYELVKEAYEQNAIDNVFILERRNLEFIKQITYHKRMEYSAYPAAIPYQDNKVSLYMGTKPVKDNEICISLNIINEIIKTSQNKLKYEDLINEPIQFRGKEFIITGITKNDNDYVYITENNYSQSIFNDFNYRKSNFRYYKIEKNLYSVISGRDINENSDELQVLVPYATNDTVLEMDGKTYTIVGVYSHPYKKNVSNMYITNDKDSMVIKYLIDYKSYNESSGLYTIIEGRERQNENEIIASAYTGNKIGDVVNGKTIVGLFTGSDEVIDCYLCDLSMAILMGLNQVKYNDSFVFDITDASKANQIFRAKNYKLFNEKTARIEEQKFDLKSVVIIFRVMFIIMAVISSIFIYFIMRSKMISDIYSIGVYRSLGASRARLNKKFLLDAIILTTFTILIGYIIAFIGYNCIANFIEDSLSMSILMKSNIITFMGGLGIYAVMIFFGMLPIIMLLRKTPSEICSKYDI